MVSMTDLLCNSILSYNGMSLFFICISIVNIRFRKHKVKQFTSIIAYQV